MDSIEQCIVGDAEAASAALALFHLFAFRRGFFCLRYWLSTESRARARSYFLQKNHQRLGVERHSSGGWAQDVGVCSGTLGAPGRGGRAA